MPHYSEVVIIYNPVSTSGQAEAKANKLADKLRKRDLKVLVQATEHAGHAEILACQAAARYKHPLIISASGDGGYNEVINGVMKAVADGKAKDPACAILPSGNANDHRRSVRKHPLAWAILHTEPEKIDLLELKVDGQPPRYAHSYIGVGITTHVASRLNRQNFGPLREKITVARSIFTYHPVAINNTDGKTRRYDSLIFANISHMAKALKVGNKKDVTSGSFRVSALPHRAQFWPIRITLNLLMFIFGLQKLPQRSSYTFSVPQNEKIHLDGEINDLPKNATVTIKLKPGALLTVR